MENELLNISYIKKILYSEVKDYYDKTNKRKDLLSSANILEDMISILESQDYNNMQENYLLFYSIFPILFDNEETGKSMLNSTYKHITYCKNYVNDPERYLKEDYERGNKYIKSLTKKIKQKLNELNDEINSIGINITEEEVNKYKKILFNLKNNNTLTSEDYDTLKELFKRKKLDNKQIILLLEQIKNHNIYSHFKNPKDINYNKSYEISNILNMGFEEFENITWIDDKRKKQFDSLIKIIINQGIKVENNHIDDKNIKNLLPKYLGDLTFSEGYTLSNVKYIYIKILKHYQDELLQANEDIKNLDNYEDKDLRNLILESCRETLLKYKYVRKIFDEELKKYNADIEKVSEEEDVQTLYFGVKESGTTYLESDLKSIPKDTYSSIKELLMLFKKDKLKASQKKPLKEIYPGTYEIRDDQIRIIYKHIKDNEYVVLGAFIKKDDNPVHLFKIHCNRKPSSIVESNVAEEDIFAKLTPHSGGRRNT